jgi:hypothetical protein
LKRSFKMLDQYQFAKLSGDSNPIHINEVVARKELFGQVVVHGIHLLLWAIDCILPQETEFKELVNVNVVFQEPVFLNEEVWIESLENNGNNVVLSITSDRCVLTNIEMQFRKRSKSVLINRYPSRANKLNTPAPEELEKAFGQIQLFLSIDKLYELFPNLAKEFSSYQVAILLATTRLVGMECPGLHSLYSGLNLEFGAVTENHELKYKVEKFHRLTRIVKIKVESPGVKGRIHCFLRPDHITQLSYKNLLKVVNSTEFSGQTALIVGGSRGLGEITAKLLCAGGASVYFTYNQGKDDAQKIVEEISEANGVVQCLSYNVLSNVKFIDFKKTPSVISHFYYFASPRISKSVGDQLDPDLVMKYDQFYIEGLEQTFSQILPYCVDNLVFFTPSTSFIEQKENGFEEYSTSKLSMETCCSEMNSRFPRFRFFIPRLPPLATDQTLSLLPNRSVPTTEIMLQCLRRMRI